MEIMRRRLKREKILFMGGNLLGCLCLKEFLRWRKVEISSVVGRYGDNGSIVDPKAWNASLLRIAAKKDLQFYQPKAVKNKYFLDLILKQERPDYIFSVQYDKILGPELLKFPKIGCINIHYAMLPYNRGCLPIPWALIDKQPVGVTIHWMDSKIDTGDIIAANELEVNSDDTAQTLYYKATQVAYKLFKDVFPKVLEKKTERIKQPQNNVAYRNSGYPYNRNIDWNWSANKIDRIVRALTFPPFPSARTSYKDMDVEVLYPVKIVHRPTNGYKPGQVVDVSSSGITVQTKRECLLISNVRLNESLNMKAEKFCKQFDVKAGDLLGRVN